MQDLGRPRKTKHSSSQATYAPGGSYKVLSETLGNPGEPVSVLGSIGKHPAHPSGSISRLVDTAGGFRSGCGYALEGRGVSLGGNTAAIEFLKLCGGLGRRRGDTINPLGVNAGGHIFTAYPLQLGCGGLGRGREFRQLGFIGPHRNLFVAGGF